MIHLSAIAAAAGIAIGAAGAWTVQSLRYEASIADIKRVHENARADQIAASARDYRRWVDRQSQSEKTHIEFVEVERVKYQTITQTVEKLVDRPVYLNVCIDNDGMRVIADTIATTDSNTSHPPSPSPAVSKSFAPD